MKQFIVVWLALAASAAGLPQQIPAPATQSAPITGSQPLPTETQINALLDRGETDQALVQLQSLRRADPQRKGLAHLFGVAYFRKGDYARAIEPLKDAVAENPNDKESTQLLGLAYYFTGRPKEAIPLLEKVQSWFSRANVDAAYVLGICYIQSMNYDASRRAFAAMYGVAPDSAAAHLFNARMLLRQGFDPIAEQEAKKAVVLDPRLPVAHKMLGDLYLFKSRIPEAIKELEAEIAINPGDAAAYYTLADAYTRVMRYEDAERLLQRSIWLDSSASGPYILMAKVLLHKHDNDMAVRSAQQALKMDPNNYIAHYLLGQALRNLGKTDEADRELKLSQQLQSAQTSSKLEQESR